MLPLIALGLVVACGPAETPETVPETEATPEPETASQPEDTTPEVSLSPLAAKGKEIAVANCAECHAIDATSESKHAEAPPFRTFSENYPVNALGEALAEGIVVGHPDMPEFSFDPDEVDALIAFIESVQPGNQG